MNKKSKKPKKHHQHFQALPLDLVMGVGMARARAIVIIIRNENTIAVVIGVARIGRKRTSGSFLCLISQSEASGASVATAVKAALPSRSGNVPNFPQENPLHLLPSPQLSWRRSKQKVEGAGYPLWQNLFPTHLGIKDWAENFCSEVSGPHSIYM